MTIQFHVVVSMKDFKVFPQDRVQQRVRSRPLTFQFRTVAGMTFLLRQRIFQIRQIWQNKGVCRTFPRLKKSAKVTSHSSQRVLRSASSSELSARQMARAARPQDFSDDGNIFREDGEKIWIRLDTGQWNCECSRADCAGVAGSFTPR